MRLLFSVKMSRRATIQQSNGWGASRQITKTISFCSSSARGVVFIIYLTVLKELEEDGYFATPLCGHLGYR
jgi:hypothetical protein